MMMLVEATTKSQSLAHQVSCFGTCSSQEALFYHTAWCSLRKIGVGLLDLHAVEIRPDMSVIVLEFVKDLSGRGRYR